MLHPMIGMGSAMMTLGLVTTASTQSRPGSLSFRHEGGRESLQSWEGAVETVEGTVYVYATMHIGPANPIGYVNGMPQWRPDGAVVPTKGSSEANSAAAQEAALGGFVIQEQKPMPEGHPQFVETIALGSKAEGRFTSALRFGLGNDRRGQERAHVTAWVSDGHIDYFAPYVRPNTPYDFKLRLDLNRKRMSAWVSGRGDDAWFLLAEGVPVEDATPSINWVKVEMYPGGPAIEELMVRSRPCEAAEQLRPHPLAKKGRVVGPNRGFTFQSLRSTWRKPGKHVTIFRQPGVHVGFPDVCQAGPDHLVCVWRNGSHTGGSAGNSIAHSYDLGRTWSKPTPTPSQFDIRVQRLRVGALLLANGPLWDSCDGGYTWTNERGERWGNWDGIDRAIMTDRVLELSDGSWLGSGYKFMVPPTGGARYGSGAVQPAFWRSVDRGNTWDYWETVTYPPHSFDEPSTLEIAPGRLVTYARESRADGMPAIRGYSEDVGRTWTFSHLPFPMTGRPCAGFLRDGRVMLTFRSGVGRAALRAWIGDANDSTGAQPAGGHYNDRHTVGLKDGSLHIDNDGTCGQFTKYTLRPPDTSRSTLDLTVEVKVVANQGRAATLSLPFAGKLRIFPDHLEMAHNSSLRVNVTPAEFHAYRIMTRVGKMQIYVDGKLSLDTDKADSRLQELPWVKVSPYSLEFGNEAKGIGPTTVETPRTMPDVYPANIAPEVTGYSIWRRVEAVVDDPTAGRRVLSWSAARDGFPDQYQLDHMVEIEASACGHDQGYSGWTQLDDGRIFVVNYTDDGAAASTPNPHNFGVPWIRGTFLDLADLPPLRQ